MSIRTVLRYEIPVDSDVDIPDVPVGAEFIHAGLRPLDGKLSVWAVVDIEAHHETRRLHVRGTGEGLGDVGRHVGSVASGPFVWHVFEEAGR